ncbi:MAG: ATP-binding protein, partial [Caulobacter sp.]
ISLQIGARERAAFAAERIELKRIETRLLAELARAENYRDGLAALPADWLELAGASGAAVIADGEIKVVGVVPPIEHLGRLAVWLQNHKVDEVFASDFLAEHWPDAEMLADTAAGVLAISISQIHASYIVWFRPEVVRTVTWGGDPRKKAATPLQPLSPRASFETWKERVRLRSDPWREAEIETARDFRNAVISFVLKRAEEKAELTEALQRTNKELESFSYSVSHDLRAPFRHIVGFSELLGERATNLDDKSRHYLDSIKDAALSAGRLVDDLLNFSHMGRTSLTLTRVDMDKLVREVRYSLAPDAEGRDIEWDIQRLPTAWGDGAMLRQVLTNLIDNAVKYTRDARPAKITITGEERARDTLYRISDNGVGFDMTYVDKLFGVFQRLHRVEDFEGTGIGLALSKRVIDRHGGDIFAEGTLGAGAAFTFVLPKR